MFQKVVVANRGAVAARVLRALRELGVASVAVYSDADRDAPWVALADEAHRLGPAPAVQSYLDQDALLRIVRETDADAVHPGYGFLSENAGFARRIEMQGARFIGPAARFIDTMGHKTRARELMAAHGLPVARGSGVLDDDPAATLAAAEAIGFPVLVKPAGGGGGIGMLPAYDAPGLAHAVERARSMSSRSFGTADVYLEKLFEQPRHIEFQVLSDSSGATRHLFERDCSLQRRHQKIVEEAPAPGLSRAVLDAQAQRAAGALQDLGYDNIGTVEMLSERGGNFSFLEMNTRLQVEHAVTEAITGVDLVIAQVRSAAGEPLAAILPETLAIRGHAIEARVYAEHPKTFMPSPGPLRVFRPPAPGNGVRVETGYAQGGVVTPYYDPLVAKVIAHGDSRTEALARLREALGAFEVDGIRTNLPFLAAALASPEFAAGEVHTGLAAVLAARQP